MIEEARRLPPSMVAVGIAFLSLFVILASGTILAVVADDTVEPPAIDDLSLTSQADIVDSIPTCTDSACDGHGVLLMAKQMDAPTLTAELTGHWRGRGWEPARCLDDGDLCFSEGELRISVRDWDQVDPLLAPTFVEEVEDQELDSRRLLYVHYYRCGIIHACE